jgi:hypothetical protein
MKVGVRVTVTVAVIADWRTRITRLAEGASVGTMAPLVCRGPNQ